ncbi:RNA polymerase sigma factor [Syntrophaceticus schinkii]|uniref:Sigma-70 region 2 n=1 Tax=Syntrophaceticus schinkii TaxID=499207 RepID=A0A0B7MG84_9FIRM
MVILHYYKDFSYDEIAYIMQTKRNTIEVRLCRARKKLRQMFEQNQEVEKCSPAGK